MVFSYIADFIENCIRWFIVWFTNFLPVKVIRDEDGRPFLYRYHLFTLGYDGPGLCIHHFVKSDPDRGYHDHPWSSAISFILCGGYEERIVNTYNENCGESFDRGVREVSFDRGNRGVLSFDTYQRKRWNFNYLDGVKNFHRVMIPEGGDAWTIFAFRGRSKTWGMIGLDGKYRPMSTQVSDADGGWWNVVGKGYSLHQHVKHPGNVIATVDIIVIAESKVLLIKRGKEPYKGHWAFPGGRIEQKDEDIAKAARRELREETQLELPLKYYTTIGNNTRDSRGFCLTNVFEVAEELIKIPNGVRAGDDAVDYTWFSIYDLPEMAFDHKEILENYLKNRRKKQ